MGANPHGDEAMADDEMRPEYDLAQLPGGVRGKYAHRRPTDQATPHYFELVLFRLGPGQQLLSSILETTSAEAVRVRPAPSTVKATTYLRYLVTEDAAGNLTVEPLS